jgi:hypothetical protein
VAELPDDGHQELSIGDRIMLMLGDGKFISGDLLDEFQLPFAQPHQRMEEEHGPNKGGDSAPEQVATPNMG